MLVGVRCDFQANADANAAHTVLARCNAKKFDWCPKSMRTDEGTNHIKRRTPPVPFVSVNIDLDNR